MNISKYYVRSSPMRTVQDHAYAKPVVPTDAHPLSIVALAQSVWTLVLKGSAMPALVEKPATPDGMNHYESLLIHGPHRCPKEKLMSLCLNDNGPPKLCVLGYSMWPPSPTLAKLGSASKCIACWMRKLKCELTTFRASASSVDYFYQLGLFSG